jgi:dipeptidyl aminopeptidase/acylaminoacyl peptidase
MLPLCASGPLTRLLLIADAAVVVTGAMPRGDAAATGLRSWKIVWLRENGGLSVWTSQRRQTFALSGTTNDDWPAVWSPDGQDIAFSRSSDRPGIYTARVGGGAPRRLTETLTDTQAEGIACSPDGRRIAYSVDCAQRQAPPFGCVSGPAGTTSLYTIDRDGSDRRRLVALTTAFAPFPEIRGLTWSRDSRRIAYVVQSADECCGTFCTRSAAMGELRGWSLPKSQVPWSGVTRRRDRRLLRPW